MQFFTYLLNALVFNDNHRVSQVLKILKLHQVAKGAHLSSEEETRHSKFINLTFGNLHTFLASHPSSLRRG